ncbi:MAG TPA: hypothetical protein VH816_17890 [Gaiellaceae bacterium]|jgi:hypothetical protein
MKEQVERSEADNDDLRVVREKVELIAKVVVDFAKKNAEDEKARETLQEPTPLRLVVSRQKQTARRAGRAVDKQRKPI